MEQTLIMPEEGPVSFVTATPMIEGNDINHDVAQAPVEIVLSEVVEGTVVYEVYHEERNISDTENGELCSEEVVDDSTAPSTFIVQKILENVTEKINSDATLEELRVSDCQKEDNVNIQTYQCCKCDESFPEFNQLNKHQKLEHSLEEFQSVEKNGCPICESSYKPKNTGTRFKPFLCGICDKGYTSVRELKKHFSIHVRTNLFFCDLCDDLFEIEEDLKEHKKEIHDSEKKYKCPICAKSFRTSSNLKSHSRVHSEIRPFICQYCKKAFKSNSELKSHVYIHTNEKPYHCETCGKTFRQSGNFHSHLRMHQNQRNHVCEICGRAFIESSKLRRHARIHSNEKPYECEVSSCRKRFSDHSNKKAHMKTHAKDNKVVYYMLFDDGNRVEEIGEDVARSLCGENNDIVVKQEVILNTVTESDKTNPTNFGTL